MYCEIINQKSTFAKSAAVFRVVGEFEFFRVDSREFVVRVF